MIIEQDGLRRPLNKLIDAKDLNKISYNCVRKDLLETKNILDRLNMPYSSHLQDFWTRHWEYATLIIDSEVESEMRVLDAGGTGTVFSYFLALMGCDVYTVDIDKQKVEDANALTPKLKEQAVAKINHSFQSIAKMSFPDNYFDRVFSICVIEHLNNEDQLAGLKEMARVLSPGGILAMTYDYVDLPQGKEYAGEHEGVYMHPEEVKDWIIKPSGLEVIGNVDLYKNSKIFGGRAPTDDLGSIGCLFLYKRP